MQGEKEEIVQALIKADLDAAAQAGMSTQRYLLYQFVRKVTFEAHHITPEDTEILRQQGYTDEEIGEAVYIAALFAFFNRVADAFGIESSGMLNMTEEQIRARSKRV